MWYEYICGLHVTAGSPDFASLLAVGVLFASNGWIGLPEIGSNSGGVKAVDGVCDPFEQSVSLSSKTGRMGRADPSRTVGEVN